MTLGDTANTPVNEARRRARILLGRVDEGQDPLTERQAKLGEMTLAEFSEIYAEHFSLRKRSWSGDEVRLSRHILPVLGSRSLSAISAADCERLHNSFLKKPSAGARRKVRNRLTGKRESEPPRLLSKASANRIICVLRHMLNFAVRRGLLHDSPARHLRMFPVDNARDIVLTPEQCRALLAACDAETNIFGAALIKLAMLTGRRVGELRFAKWEHLDLRSRLLTVPETKAGERQYVVLDQPAIDVLTRLPRVEGNPYIIAGAKAGRPIFMYKKAWGRVVRRAGIPYFPLHGLRHNFASMLVAAGVPLPTVGDLLGHKSPLTTQRYAHHRPTICAAPRRCSGRRSPQPN